jgi:hypothetical protein
MELRKHPLMSYGRVPNWPPAWVWIGGRENQYPKGEVGILSKVWFSAIKPFNKCYLRMEFRGGDYLGVLLFDDVSFCRQAFKLLSSNLGRSIKEIGDLNTSYTL